MTEWRTGSKLGRTLYRDEVFVGCMDTPELAAEVVAALNGRLRALAPAERIAATLDDTGHGCEPHCDGHVFG